MSRATVRAALTSGFAAVSGLTTVTSSEKKFQSANEFYSAVGNHSGAVAFVFIERELESRRALGGWKKLSYDVGLVCKYRHNGIDPTDTYDAGIQAMDEWDTTLENIKVYTRAHRTMNGGVWQIGEGDTLHGDDIEIQSDLPVTDKDGFIHIWSVVRFKVIDWVQT